MELAGDPQGFLLRWGVELFFHELRSGRERKLARLSDTANLLGWSPTSSSC